MIFVKKALTIAIAVASGALGTGVVSAPAAPSPDPFVDANQATPSPIRWARLPPEIQLTSDGRMLLADLQWRYWPSDALGSVAIAAGTEERWQCPDPSNCPFANGSGGYVNYPVNVMLEWPAVTSHGYAFTTIVISSPTFGTHAAKLFF